MTRSSGLFKRIGSISKNLKRLAIIAALFTTAEVACTESSYSMRLHKNFIKEVMDKNFRVILSHIQKKVQKDVFLTEINANIDNLSLQIKPIANGGASKSQRWDAVETDLFFDQGQIVMELAGLEYIGSGKITDPETGVQEKIDLSAKLDLCQLVLSLEQELTDDGNLYPKIEISEVAFTLHPDTFIVNADGDLPLYKNHKFEEGIKKWMTLQIAQREQEFKLALQRSEREIMSSFAFKKDLPMGATAHSSLSETMNLQGDHVVINYETEFQGAELNDIQKKMRKIRGGFSDEEAYMRDLQVVIDENYINYMLFQLFYNQKSYSLTETIVEYMPEEWLGGGTALRAIMNTQVWSFLFPDLADEYANQRLDFRCGWNKDYLQKGKLQDSSISQIQFKDENTIDLNLHFGCGLYVYDNGVGKKKSEIEQLMDLFQSMAASPDDKQWKEHISFFISLQGEVDLDFSDGAKTFKPPNIPGMPDMVNEMIDNIGGEQQMTDGFPMIFGIMKDFRPVVKELKVFNKHGDAMMDQADDLNDKIMNLNEISRTDPKLKMVTDTIFSQGIPMVPFPEVSKCLGLNAKDSTMKIKEGYAILAFDYDVKSSNDNCLFNMKQSLSQKEGKMASKLGKMGGLDFAAVGEKLMKGGLKGAMKKLPPLNIPGFDMVQDNINILQDNFDMIQNVAGNFDPSVLDKIAGGVNPMDFDPTKMSLDDISNLMEKGKQGADMVKGFQDKIEALDNPLLNEAVNKIKDNEMLGKLKDIDVGAINDNIKNLGANVDDMKNKAEGLFKLFQ